MRGTRLVAGEKGLYEEDAADRIFEAPLDLPLRRAVLRQLGIHRRAEQAAANLIVIFVAQGRAARAPDADALPRRVGEQIFGQTEQVAAIARQLDAAALEPGESGAPLRQDPLRHKR